MDMRDRLTKSAGMSGQSRLGSQALNANPGTRVVNTGTSTTWWWWWPHVHEHTWFGMSGTPHRWYSRPVPRN